MPTGSSGLRGQDGSPGRPGTFPNGNGMNGTPGQDGNLFGGDGGAGGNGGGVAFQQTSFAPRTAPKATPRAVQPRSKPSSPRTMPRISSSTPRQTRVNPPRQNAPKPQRLNNRPYGVISAEQAGRLWAFYQALTRRVNYLNHLKATNRLPPTFQSRIYQLHLQLQWIKTQLVTFWVFQTQPRRQATS